MKIWENSDLSRQMKKNWSRQSYEIKSPPWTILWLRILGIFSVENIKRLCIFMFKTCSNSQLLRRVLWINAEQTIIWSLKHKIIQPSYIFNRENPKNSEPQNGPRRGLDYIAFCDCISIKFNYSRHSGYSSYSWFLVLCYQRQYKNKAQQSIVPPDLKSLTSEAATQFFKRAYKISHPPRW